MTEREALTIFYVIQKCRHQALHTNDCGNCERCQYRLEQEQIDGAVALAISVLEKQEKERWIPCKERLPEYEKEVLTCDDSGGMSVGYLYSPGFGHADRWHVDFTYSPVYHIVAWRPLPEAYTEEEA